MTDGELEILRESDRLAHKRRRREINDLDLLMAREGDAIRRRLGIPVNVSDRDNEVREELLRCVEEQRARNAERMVTTRAEALVNMTDEERAEERDRQVARMATAREEARIGIFHADARLGVTPAPFTLGERNHLCPYCKSLRFEGESSSTCCGNGSVVLEESQKLCPYPTDLQSLLQGKHPNSRNFFEYIRSYNCAVGFASMGVRQHPHQGEVLLL